MIFSECKLELSSSISLGDSIFAIESLSFEYWGIIHDNDWPGHPEKLEVLAKAIADSSLKDSLQEIDLREWGGVKKKMKAILKKYGVKDVSVY